ncbi:MULTISPECIES: PRC-barrel domain containing protein [unclassified Streptomyces]|uniref:PRC-barrel domain containing protein n=1 Tax=unclassified Streptomyces TaxID=2593676 RepID=UPI0036F7AEC3
MTDDLWNYSPTCGHRSGMDLAGWSVMATDGFVGRVAEHSEETGDAHLVLDAGAWIFGKLLIPASAVVRCEPEERTIRLALSREQVEDAPQHLTETDRADPQYRDDVVAYFVEAARTRRSGTS